MKLMEMKIYSLKMRRYLWWIKRAIAFFCIVLLFQIISCFRNNDHSDEELSKLELNYYEWRLKPKGFCDNNDNIDLVVIIHTKPAHFVYRQIYRQIYEIQFEQSAVRVLFSLGNTPNSRVQRKIDEESRTRRDILQQNFIDDKNSWSVFKNIMWLQYFTKDCPNIKYVLKAEENTVFNIHEILNIIGEMNKGKQKVINVFCGKMGITENTKWCNSYESSNDSIQKCISHNYIIPGEVIPELLQAAKNITKTPDGDEYLLCALSKKANIKVERPKIYKKVSSVFIETNNLKKDWNFYVNVTDHSLDYLNAL